MIKIYGMSILILCGSGLRASDKETEAIDLLGQKIASVQLTIKSTKNARKQSIDERNDTHDPYDKRALNQQIAQAYFDLEELETRLYDLRRQQECAAAKKMNLR